MYFWPLFSKWTYFSDLLDHQKENGYYRDNTYKKPPPTLKNLFFLMNLLRAQAAGQNEGHVATA